MIMHHTEYDFLSAFFSDETERFRSPAEPDPGETVTIRLRGPNTEEVSVSLVVNGTMGVPMRRGSQGTRFQMFEAEIRCLEEPIYYCFHIEYRGQTYVCRRDGTKKALPGDETGQPYAFRFMPGFHTPAWARGAVQYQIFPDRFRNGDPGNDVEEGEYTYNHQHVRKIPDWNAAPGEDDYRCFYGGDIAGIMQKLDYLQDLGIEVIYLNPIFLSPSSHKYDAQDYEHVDPHFGVIEEDIDHPLQSWEYHNGYARKYITRVLSEVNTEKTDALFASLCEELHSRGMKIILDGVFNHCGSFHRWMDREGIYLEKPGYAPGAYQDGNSPYREFFHFMDEYPGYEAWWDVETLPKLCYEQSRTLCEEIFFIAEKWLRPPYSIDGWRLDVAADLGHNPSANHAFWREFRDRVKGVNPEALILAEHYGDPSPWLKGDEWDSVMNYDAFMDPLGYFLTGMEKHSDNIRDDLYQDGKQFFDEMQRTMDRFHWNSLQCAMNELSNHDHSRFLTRTNRTVGRLETLGAAAAEEGVDKSVFREAVVIQMTWPGAPTVYYGDEAGLAGWTDPDNRRGYPWGREDQQMIELHRSIISLRRKHPVLRSGSFLPLGGGYGWIAYARFDSEDCIIVSCNNSTEAVSLSIDVGRTGVEDGARFVRLFVTDISGYSDEEAKIGVVSDGHLTMDIGPKSALILTPQKRHGEGEAQ